MNFFESNRNKIKIILQNEDWQADLDSKFGINLDPQTKENVMWALVDLIREDKKEYLERAMAIAEKYAKDPDPVPGDKYDLEARAGEDVRYIFTVRATLSHLLSAILSRLDTDYYPRVLDLLEKLIKDENIYVRTQAMLALDGFAVNIYAEKRNDGKTPFSFDRERVEDLIFYALKDNQEYPRVLEYLANPLNRLRRLKSDKAKYLLSGFIYKNFNKKDGFHPEYVLRGAAPLLIYYAEFRDEIGDNFDKSFFVELLLEVITVGDPSFRATLLWHFWKTIEGDNQTYKRLKRYIPVFFEAKFEEEFIAQMGFLIEKILKVDFDFALEIFAQLLRYIEVSKPDPRKTVWLWGVNQLFQNIASQKPEVYLDYLNLILNVWKLGNVFVGDYGEIFTAYKLSPEEYKENLKKGAQEIYSKMRMIRPELDDLLW